MALKIALHIKDPATKQISAEQYISVIQNTSKIH